LVISFTSEPAYSTLTAPEPVADEEADEDADGDDAAVLELAALADVAAGVLVELEEELHPAAARPRKATPTMASRARGDRNESMITTLAIVTCAMQPGTAPTDRTLTYGGLVIVLTSAIRAGSALAANHTHGARATGRGPGAFASLSTNTRTRWRRWGRPQ
jgi:hypothetical protein